MKIFNKILVIALFVTFFENVSAQQDPQFNLGFTNPTYVNPGYAGNNAEDLFCASAFNRLELTGFDGAPISTVLNVQGPINIFGINSGISFSILNEIIGQLRAPAMNLGYAYRHSLGKGSIGIGVSAGFVASWYVANDWRLPDGSTSESAGTIPTQENAGVAFDAGAGIFYSTPRWFAGVSATHLTSPKLGVDKNARYVPTLYAMGGYSFLLDTTTWILTPMVNIVSDFTQTSYNIACKIAYNEKYVGGINYRWGQAVAAFINLELFEGIKLGYSYEFPTSQLSRFTGGTHELMLSYSFAVKVPRGSQQYKSVRYL